jgi:hypothetical protein
MPILGAGKRGEAGEGCGELRFSNSGASIGVEVPKPWKESVRVPLKGQLPSLISWLTRLDIDE